MNKTAFIIVIFGILLSELIFQWNQTCGFVVYALLIGIVLISMERDTYVNKSDILLIFLMIIPIARISSLFIDFGILLNIFIFYAIVASLTIFYSNKLVLKSKENSLKGKLSYALLAVLIGVILSLVGKFMFDMKNPFLLFLIVFIAYTEEILFREKIQNLSNERYNAFYSVFFTSILYAIFSLSYGFPIFIFAFVASLILCLIYNYTKNIYLTFLWNIIFHSAFFGFYLINLI